MKFNKSLLSIGLLLIETLWIGCVDVPNGPSTTIPDFRSQVRFVHAMPGGATGNFSVDGVSIGNAVGPLTATGYNDVASGSRSIAFGSAIQTISFGSEKQSTVLVYFNAGVPSFLQLSEGDKDKNYGRAGSAKIKFVNAADGGPSDVTFFDGTTVLATSAFGAATNYTVLVPGTISLTAYSSAGAYTATLEGSQQVPPVTTTSSGTATVAQTYLGGVSYSITVTADNAEGFYTSAHFHNAPSGSAGPIVLGIDVSKQRMTLPLAILSGANEPSPVVTPATGTGTFTLWRDSLQFSITVTADTLDLFTAGHFHNAAAGATGPVVRTIASGGFGNSVFTGTWKSTDSEPLTPSLVSELIAGNIYVNFHSTSNPGGVIRAQLAVDAATSSIYSGVWNDSTLTTTLREEFNSNNIYINFHTATNPGGQVRGQVTTGTRYVVATLPASTFDDGKVYTAVATGSGSGFQLTTFQDRQGPGPAIGKPEVITAKSKENN